MIRAAAEAQKESVRELEARARELEDQVQELDLQLYLEDPNHP
jgi:hypothetical protein